LLLSYIMILIIRLFVKIRISLFKHFFIVTYIKHVSLKFRTMNTSFTQNNLNLLELQIVASGVYMLHIDL